MSSLPVPSVLTHAQIWGAIDALAALAGTSPSGLAKRAGLDPTTFNKSKRVTSDLRQRWPSTESVAKCLEATGVTLDQFVALVAAIRRGDRVVVKIRSGEVIAKELARKTSKAIELKALNPSQPDRTLG